MFYQNNFCGDCDVIIATPGDSMRSEYVRSLVRTLDTLHRRGISYAFTNSSSSLVHHARELTASGTVKELDPYDVGPLKNRTYKKMFWIDSDIEWTPEDFMTLYESGLDVVSGAYLLADGKKTCIATKDHPGGIPKDLVAFDKVIEIESCGFGFVCIKHGVFEKISRPWFAHLPHEIVPGVVESLGEDISFCMKARALGYRIHLDSSVRVTHVKSVPVKF